MSSRELQTLSRPFLLLALLMALLPATDSEPAAAQTPPPREGTSTQTGGYDYFQTLSPGTYVDLRGDLALPAGFFDQGSPRFAGRVAFQGSPLKEFKGHSTGKTDTIVVRNDQQIAGGRFPRRGSARLEVVALAMRSVQPIRMRVDRKRSFGTSRSGSRAIGPRTAG